jgi:rubrerythrin
MPNNDLISRKALIEQIEEDAKHMMFTSHHSRMLHDDMVEFAVNAIECAPTVDAEPMRRGSWGECRITGYDGLHAVYTRPCSECGHEARFSTNYCPICGAKMDKEK